MMSYNSVTFIGNVGRDPEMRSTDEGTLVVNFSLAVDTYWPIRPADEIYNASSVEPLGLRSQRRYPLQKNCFLPLSFISVSSQDQLR